MPDGRSRTDRVWSQCKLNNIEPVGPARLPRFRVRGNLCRGTYHTMRVKGTAVSAVANSAMQPVAVQGACVVDDTSSSYNKQTWCDPNMILCLNFYVRHAHSLLHERRHIDSLSLSLSSNGMAVFHEVFSRRPSSRKSRRRRVNPRAEEELSTCSPAKYPHLTEVWGGGRER